MAKDPGVSNDYLTEKMHQDLQMQHNGGHTDAPNLKFLFHGPANF